MTIERLWLEIEAEIDTSAGGAWLTRLARPQPGQPLLVAVERASRNRCLLLPVDKAQIPSRSAWPSCAGLELFIVALDGQSHLGVRLKDSNCGEVFAALAENIADRVVSSGSAKQAASALLERLKRWQQFLSSSRDGLGLEAQRGLWGELRMLQQHLVPEMGAGSAIESWKGPEAGHQDFQFGAGVIEVKATVAKQPQTIRISSERQLDDTGGALFLHVFILDEREDPAARDRALTLPDLIGALRIMLAADSLGLSTFNSRLFDAGWLDTQASRYSDLRWTVRSEHTYRVGPGFPRLTENVLPTGIGHVSYEISLPACAGFEIPLKTALGSVRTSGPADH